MSCLSQSHVFVSQIARSRWNCLWIFIILWTKSNCNQQNLIFYNYFLRGYAIYSFLLIEKRDHIDFWCQNISLVGVSFLILCENISILGCIYFRLSFRYQNNVKPFRVNYIFDAWVWLIFKYGSKKYCCIFVLIWKTP